MYDKYEVCKGVKLISQDNLPEMYLNQTWRPALSITGADGIPPIAKAGNVCRKSTTLRLAMRLPPNADPHAVTKNLKAKLTKDVPFRCKVTFDEEAHAGSGYMMKEPEPYLASALKQVGSDFFDGKDVGTFGRGGSIPFLAELGKLYPTTQIFALGLMGPGTNQHAQNERINLDYAKRLTCSLSHLIAAVGAQ